MCKRIMKSWPKDCLWSKPQDDVLYPVYHADEVDEFYPLSNEIEDLLKIKEYYDELVEEGYLDEEYSLIDESEKFILKTGEEYWIEDHFDISLWEMEVSEQIHMLKIDPCDALIDISRIIGYDFINENLVRQAFTRRSFSIDYGLQGDNEQLEFYGDSILNTIVTKEIYKQFSELDASRIDAPFVSAYNEGELSKIRNHFISKEYLSLRAMELGLDKYNLYGKDEEPNESAREDMMEALIGAVAADSDWNWDILNEVADKLLCLQLYSADRFLKKTYYDIFNAWHQRHFRKMPEYEISGNEKSGYYCSLRFNIPENDKGIDIYQQLDVKDWGRSRTREHAARKAYDFVKSHGLWINLKEAGIIPDLDNSINQLQELYQKKYVEQPQYTFEEKDDGWHCECLCEGTNGFGKGENKTKAKKKAAYMTLIRLYDAAGICKKEWRDKMWEDLLG